MIKIDFINNKLYPANDIGISKLFIDSFKDELLFCKDLGVWYVWNDKYWQQDTKDGGKRHEMLKELAMYCTKTLVFNSELEDRQKEALLKVYNKLLTKNYRDTILRDAMSVAPVEYSMFDKDKFLFNCQNGTYNFDTGEFKKFDRLDYITNISNCNYNKNAKCPQFNKYLTEVMENNEHKIDYLMKMISYCYTGSVNLDCFFILYGATTRNGKSTFVNLHKHILGTYTSTMDSSSITRKQINNGGSNPTPDIADIKDSRLVTISEIEQNMMIDIALIKKMTGKSKLKARKLHENCIEFYPSFKLLIDTNFLPKMTDDSIFGSGRIHLIEFTRHFTEEERDYDLAEKLAKESDGIFNLVIQYYNAFKIFGLKMPEESKAVLDRYRLNSNNILLFINESLFEDKSSFVKASLLFEKYTEWCVDSGLKAMAKKNFRIEMERNGALYCEMESHKNDFGVFEKTNWYKGYSITKVEKNVNENVLIPLENDKELPF